MKLFIQPSARKDILEQYRYYLDAESKQLADRFLLAVNQAIDKIELNPSAGSPRRFANPRLKGLRSLRAPGFDDVRIYYLVDTRSISSRLSGSLTH